MDVIQNLNKTYLSKSETTTDNWVFRLHYKYSILILVLFGLLTSSTQYFGTKIECTSSKKNVDRNFVNQYCWIHPTFVVANMSEDKVSSFF